MVCELRDAWEATSFRLEREQCAVECVDAEQRGLASRQAPSWSLPYTPAWTPSSALQSTSKPRIAIIRSDLAPDPMQAQGCPPCLFLPEDIQCAISSCQAPRQAGYTTARNSLSVLPSCSKFRAAFGRPASACNGDRIPDAMSTRSLM